MSFLARIAARATGALEPGVATLAPKDQALSAMRAAAPAEDMPDEAPETGPGAIASRVVRRAPSDAKPSPDDKKEEQDAKSAPARPARRAAAEPPKDDKKDEKAARAAWRAAVMPPEQDDGARADLVGRALAPASDEQMTEGAELPEQTRHEKEPQKALAVRAARRDGAPTAVVGATPGPVASSLVAPVDIGFGEFGDGPSSDDWRPSKTGETFPGEAPDEAPPTSTYWEPDRPAAASGAGVPTSLGRPAEQGGVVIEQIDVFVQEPVSREATRPRLSDPARALASRYLRAL